MLIEASDLIDGDPTGSSAQVIVIGAGAAGLTCARELAAQGRDVIVLEAGGRPPDDSHREYFAGENIGQPYDLVGTRYRGLGGATNLWAGWCRPLDRYEMQYHRWVGGLPWPIRRDELIRYTRRAADLLGLGEWEWDASRIASRQGRQSLDDVPGADRYLSSVVWRFVTAPLSFAERFADFIDGPESRIVLRAPVTRIDVQGQAARGVQITLDDGRTHIVECETIVMAAGGIENVRLLLELDARLRAADRTLDRSGWLGRGWQEHPHVAIGSAQIPHSVAEGPLWMFTQRGDIDGVPTLTGLSLPTRELRRRRMSALSVSIDPMWGATAPYSAGVAHAAEAVFGEPVRPHLLFARTESRPIRGSRVTLGRTRDALGRRQIRLNWALAEGDYRDLRVAARLIGRAFVRLGLGIVHETVDPADLSRRIGGGAHHIGGARMSEDPHRGVTDPMGALHEVPNVIVTGSAIFPSGGFSNPTLTIMALALRQSAYIAAGGRA